MASWDSLCQVIANLNTKLRGIWYSFLLKFPLPAGDKWQVSLRLLQSEINGFSRVAKKSQGVAQGEALVARSLHQAGKEWVQEQLPVSVSSACQPGDVADTLTVMLKTLDLPSRVQTSHGKIEVTTFRCPFLDEAKRSGEPGIVVCERTCGEIKSLFKGFSEGFPTYVPYQAPKMMGAGADVCVKGFNAVGMCKPQARRPDRASSRKVVSYQEPPGP